MKRHLFPRFSFGDDRRAFHFRLFAVGLLIGALAGAVVSLFRYALAWPEINRGELISLLKASPALCALYFAAIIAAGCLLRYLLKIEPLISGSGIPQIKAVLAGDFSMRWLRVLAAKFLGVVVAIGCGLSLGRAGPSVQLGGAIGAGVSALTKRSHEEQHYLIMSGAGAALAALFNAPLAGVIFCLEELGNSFSPQILVGTLASSLVATAVSRTVFGSKPIFSMPELPPWPLGDHYILFAALGVFVALLGTGFSRSLLWLLDFYQSRVRPRWRPFPPLAAACLLLFIKPEITGCGTRLVDALAAYDYSQAVAAWLWPLGWLFFGKFFFTVFCFGSGMPGGTFMPMFVLGAIAGTFFSVVCIALGILPSAAYAPSFIVFAMAGFFAAATKSPVTAAVLIMEITGTFAHIMPVMAVTLTAFLVSDALGNEPFYDMLLARSRRMRAAQQTGDNNEGNMK